MLLRVRLLYCDVAASCFRYKSECVVEAEPSTVFRYIEPRADGPRSQWDKAVKCLDVIDTIDDVSTPQSLVALCKYTSVELRGWASRQLYKYKCSRQKSDGCITSVEGNTTQGSRPLYTSPTCTVLSCAVD